SLLASACGLAPAAPPPPSATLGTPKATALSELPPTWTLAPTATLLPTKTPRPTATPTQDPNNYRIDLVMPAEIAPYPDQFVDRTGWIMLEGKTAAVSLPPSFVALDIVSPLMEMMQGMVEAFAEGFTDFAESLGDELGTTPETTPEPIDLGELPAFDFLIALEESSQSTVLLVSAGRGPETTTEDVLNEGLSNLESEFLVTSRERYNEAPLPMERVILSIENEELGRGVQVVYAILGPDAAWNLIFATSADLADHYLPIFESAADSFVPHP
ncbi:MAG: hypothetical protein P8Y34_08615, partial [Anaerolineales bacterium]